MSAESQHGVSSIVDLDEPIWEVRHNRSGHWDWYVSETASTVEGGGLMSPFLKSGDAPWRWLAIRRAKRWIATELRHRRLTVDRNLVAWPNRAPVATAVATRQRVTDALAATCRLHEVIGTCAACERRLTAVLDALSTTTDRAGEQL